MDKYTKYIWWFLILTILVLAFLTYTNQEELAKPDNEEFTMSAEKAENIFKERIKELVGIEKYKDIIKYYTFPREFWGCENYLWDMKKHDRIVNEIPPLMKEKKYNEVIALSDKYYLNDSEIWYCDSYPWTQRAKAYFNLDNCQQSLIEATHAFAVAPNINDVDREERDLYFLVANSEICKK